MAGRPGGALGHKQALFKAKSRGIQRRHSAALVCNLRLRAGSVASPGATRDAPKALNKYCRQLVWATLSCTRARRVDIAGALRECACVHVCTVRRVNGRLFNLLASTDTQRSSAAAASAAQLLCCLNIPCTMRN
eukprot:19119-Heterococcus_DN1.PRE.3